MPQIVKADFPQIIFFQQQGKMLCQITGFYSFPDFINIDKVQIIRAITVTTQSPVLFLFPIQAAACGGSSLTSSALFQ